MGALFTIPAGPSFADALAAGLLARSKADPLALANYLILLPTRRACRTLRDAFLRQSDGAAMLLPRLVPLGNLDANEIALTGGANLPPALSPRRRQLLLTQLIGRAQPDWPLARQLATARQLGRLLDDMAIEQADPSKLPELAQTSELSEHWQITLQFLQPVLAAWPAIVAAEGAMDGPERRNALLHEQAAIWTQAPPAHPVIAAGITGAIPAVIPLLKAILAMPGGQVILPGLPPAAECREWWDLLDEPHPLYGLHDLLTQLEIPLTQVALWPAGEENSAARRDLLHTALLPAAATESWKNLPAFNAEGLIRATCRSEQEEATLIALVLRNVLETPGRTGTLVTADRRLGRRVAQLLRRWGLGIDDSAGQPLSKTEPATFLRLLLSYAIEPDGFNLLALLKHPLAEGGVPPQTCRSQIRAIEVSALRGKPRLRNMADLLRRAPPHGDWLQDVASILTPLTTLVEQNRTVSLCHVLPVLIDVAEKLSRPERVWKAEAGEALAEWVSELHNAARDFPALPVGQLPDVFSALMSDVTVRLRYGDHPRLTLLGPLEARLQSADVLILGGLNEGNWPALPEADPWMSRPMRRQFGLKSPEMRLGEQAHDFYTLAAAPQVFLTRAERQGDSPSVPARWLRRLDTLLEAQKIHTPYQQGESWLALARLLDDSAEVAPAPRPQPCPPLSARPTSLSVTQVETLQRDPYSIYAQKILGLKPLEAIEPEPGYSERGTLIHKILQRAITEMGEHLSPSSSDDILKIADDELREAGLDAEKALWWPRIRKIIDWFIVSECAARARGHGIPVPEIKGSVTLKQGFELTAKADRISLCNAGNALAIIDYKTGSVPNKKDRERQISVQLPLEAYMASQGGFKGIPALPVEELSFWQLTGGDPAGKIIHLHEARNCQTLQQDALAALEELLETYRNPQTPYTSLPNPELAPRYNDYAHLARVKEWGNAADENDDEALSSASKEDA